MPYPNRKEATVIPTQIKIPQPWRLHLQFLLHAPVESYDLKDKTITLNKLNCATYSLIRFLIIAANDPTAQIVSTWGGTELNVLHQTHPCDDRCE